MTRGAHFLVPLFLKLNWNTRKNFFRIINKERAFMTVSTNINCRNMWEIFWFIIDFECLLYGASKFTQIDSHIGNLNLWLIMLVDKLRWILTIDSSVILDSVFNFKTFAFYHVLCCFFFRGNTTSVLFRTMWKIQCIGTGTTGTKLRRSLRLVW